MCRSTVPTWLCRKLSSLYLLASPLLDVWSVGESWWWHFFVRWWRRCSSIDSLDSSLTSWSYDVRAAIHCCTVDGQACSHAFSILIRFRILNSSSAVCLPTPPVRPPAVRCSFCVAVDVTSKERWLARQMKKLAWSMTDLAKLSPFKWNLATSI